MDVFPAPVAIIFVYGTRQRPGKVKPKGECSLRSSRGIMGGWFLKCVSHDLDKLCVWMNLIGTGPVKWSTQLAGSSSVLAGTGDGTARPLELYLCTTSNRFCKSVIL